MTISLRPANATQDIPALKHLYGYLLPQPPSDDYVQRVIADTRIRLAETADGQVTGFRVLSRRQTMPATQAFVWVAVDDTHRGRGIGSRLMRDALHDASEQGYTELISQVPDDDAAALAFCGHFHFRPNRHLIKFVLHLDDWQPSPIQKAPAEGIKFITYADAGDTDTNRRRLYQLNKQLSATIPIDEPEHFPDFEPYRARRLTGDAFPHEGVHLAVTDDDSWIAMSQISLHESYAFVEMTGVLPAYRGWGIATHLKRLSLLFAKQQGYAIVRTYNDAGNQPIRAVNRNAGFIKESGFYFVNRTMPDDD
jgi:GNAT superfamily N-acetyltransferase